ncbi:MAG: hypothetical protein WBL20_19255 [Sphingobium sp.]|uniref:hypothetical protein n=1 Tax=Sphingobium sp. TaxID=1912891 RepID=UPI003BAE736C
MKPDDDISQEVRHWPGAKVIFEMGGRHGRAILTFQGKEQFVTYSTTPGDKVHGPKNNIAMIRRTLKRLGAIRVAMAGRAGRKRRRNPSVALFDACPGEPAPIMPDPWEPLREASGSFDAKCGETQVRQSVGPMGEDQPQQIASIDDPQVPQTAAPEPCDCLACASDMAGIYPCLIEGEQ